MYSVLHSTQFSGQPNQANGSTNPNCCLGTILATRTLYTILATRNLCYLVMATLAIMFPKSAQYEKDRVWIRLGHFGRLQPILWSNCQKIPLFFTTWHLHICFCIFASWNRQNAFNGHSLFQPHIKGAVLRTSRTNIFETPTGKKRLKICIKQNFNAKFFIYAKHKMHTFLNINGEEKQNKLTKEQLIYFPLLLPKS